MHNNRVGTKHPPPRESCVQGGAFAGGPDPSCKAASWQLPGMKMFYIHFMLLPLVLSLSHGTCIGYSKVTSGQVTGN